jgi:hypothetical protein
MGLIVSHSVQETKFIQIRFPKSKKKRIRKKWSKRPENWELRYDKSTKGYVLGDKMIVGPETFKRIKNVIEANG